MSEFRRWEITAALKPDFQSGFSVGNTELFFVKIHKLINVSESITFKDCITRITYVNNTIFQTDDQEKSHSHDFRQRIVKCFVLLEKS